MLTLKRVKLKQDSIRNFRLIWWTVANFDSAELIPPMA